MLVRSHFSFVIQNGHYQVWQSFVSTLVFCTSFYIFKRSKNVHLGAISWNLDFNVEFLFRFFFIQAVFLNSISGNKTKFNRKQTFNLLQIIFNSIFMAQFSQRIMQTRYYDNPERITWLREGKDYERKEILRLNPGPLIFYIFN